MEERTAVEAWCAERPEHRTMVAAARRVWDGYTADAPAAPDLAGMWERISREVRSPKGVGSRVAQTTSWPSPARSSRYIMVLSGAVFLGIFSFGLLRHRTPELPASTQTYATSPGQHRVIVLANGSRAILGPATTLFVTTAPHARGIGVRVQGQALFTVSHQTRTPFQVHAGGAVAQVLGTTFFVRHYEADPVARVVVVDGRVSVRATHGDAGTPPAQVLTANTLGTVDDSGHVRVTSDVTAEEYTSWTRGTLVFRKTPARDVVAELSRAYGVEIRIADSSLATHPLSWTVVLPQRSLNDVLESLSDAFDAHPVRAGRIITLVSGRAPKKRSDPRTPSPLSPSPESSYGK